MPTTDYYTMNGEIVGETTTGSSRLDYIRDGLGSVVATVDQTKTVQSTASYKPYGDILASTGAQPRFGWNGTSGYLTSDETKYSEMLAAIRFYSSSIGDWCTPSIIWSRVISNPHSIWPATFSARPGHQAVKTSSPCASRVGTAPMPKGGRAGRLLHSGRVCCSSWLQALFDDDNYSRPYCNGQHKNIPTCPLAPAPGGG